MTIVITEVQGYTGDGIPQIQPDRRPVRPDATTNSSSHALGMDRRTKPTSSVVILPGDGRRIPLADIVES